MTSTHVQHLDAGHDRNGNPLRLWLFYSVCGLIDRVHDEGFGGIPKDLVARFKSPTDGLVQLPNLSIPRKEYTELKAMTGPEQTS